MMSDAHRAGANRLQNYVKSELLVYLGNFWLHVFSPQYCSLISSIVPSPFFAKRCARIVRSGLGPSENKIVTCGMECFLSSRTISQDHGSNFALEMNNWPALR